ncbi:MAG TPA: glycosyltransferase family A protein [bacterium]|nr:glycosyltransferase family A protein [bacterium]
MKRPFFSIILPTFNRERLLPRAIASLQAQDFQDWELLIVDDGSTDGSAAWIRTIQEKDPRVHLLMKHHQGLAPTRNLGVAFARGEFLTFLDSDDEYLAGHLRRHAEYFRDHPEVDMMHGKVEVVGDPTVPDARDTSKTIPIADCTQPGTFFIRQAMLEALGGFPVKDFGEDSAFLELAQSSGYRVVLSPFKSYRYYNTEPDSMCNQLKAKMREGGSS